MAGCNICVVVARIFWKFGKLEMGRLSRQGISIEASEEIHIAFLEN